MTTTLLNGLRVCLSASWPDINGDSSTNSPAVQSHEPSGSTNDYLIFRQFIRDLLFVVSREAGYLVHGSHPSVVKIIREYAAENPEIFKGEWINLVRLQKKDETVSADTPRDATASPGSIGRAEDTAGSALSPLLAGEDFAVFTPVVPSNPSRDYLELSFKDRKESLLKLRDVLVNRADVLVAIGGQHWETDRKRAGVPKEIELFLAAGKPVFVITAAGQAAAGYIEQDPTRLGRLKNGWTKDQNMGLNSEIKSPTDCRRAVESLIEQINRLPLRRVHVLEADLTGRENSAANATGTDSGTQTLRPRDSFRILSLSGGGIRGAYTAGVLAAWYNALDADRKEKFVEHFDLIAGTSTGAILAVGLAMGISPNEMIGFYQKFGPTIFPKPSVCNPGPIWRSLRHWLFPKYSAESLRAALASVKPLDKELQEARRPLVLPSASGNSGAAVVITTPHHSSRTLHRNWHAQDAIMASAAAPTYFSHHEVTQQGSTSPFIDGGLWANNPIMVAIAEATAYLEAMPERIHVLSVGTTSGGGADYKWMKRAGIARFAYGGVDLLYEAQESGSGLLASGLLNDRLVVVNKPMKNRPKLDDSRRIADLIRQGKEDGDSDFYRVNPVFFSGGFAPPWKRH